MPTPESEAFLAKKPKVPPTFQGVDFADHQAVVDARDAIIREQWVTVMMRRLVGEEMGKCYAREGVNHLEKCGKYRERYLQLLKENREKGYRGQQQNYMPGVDGPAGGPEIYTNYPTAQQAKGTAGSDSRPGNTTGKGGDVLY
ncbi:NADH-ubiquinone oxidoreductase 12 kDa subunit, mitochondrial [Exophiala mesophila]|uniref:NADH-ubiquinone oxidoreductase 12 kDa subunit, mitochondrial n=1 Tax=Exophiala mesophila TaxID=212818 RepID=A0A0D1ZTA8_EXOME|nr:NADH-ubiquinone oxidoreductase 12 kDa subunit, mitochondrial [Exophiala mesophila]KIV97822.1 NADH-ubiquinone oxidoreductase 12 kDa subunit, mitochondrial [Exophiala mesophila]